MRTRSPPTQLEAKGGRKGGRRREEKQDFLTMTRNSKTKYDLYCRQCRAAGTPYSGCRQLRSRRQPTARAGR